jgi:hypothetical protein
MLSTATKHQTIDLTGGGKEFTLPVRATELSGKDISLDVVRLGLGDPVRAAPRYVPDTLVHGTELSDDGVLLHWAEASLLIGVSLIPALGTYWVYIKVSDTPEEVPRRADYTLTLI